jgi:hypothetical protein
MNIKKVLGSSFVGSFAVSSVLSCSSASAANEVSVEELYNMSADAYWDFCEKLFFEIIDCAADLIKKGGSDTVAKWNFKRAFERLKKIGDYARNLGRSDRRNELEAAWDTHNFEERLKIYAYKVLPSPWAYELMAFNKTDVEVPEKDREAFNVIKEELKQI